MIFPSNIQDDAIAVRQMPSKWCSEGWLRRFLVGAMACMAVVLFAGCLSSSSNGDSGTGTQPPPPDEDGDGDGGTGLPPDGQIHINVTSPYDFGDVVLGQSSSVTVSIHNRVGEQIVLNPLDITGATDVFSSTGLSQQTVPENQFATFTISFNPQSEGDFQAVFAITVQSPDGPDDINLTVLGSGFEPELGEIGLDVSDPLRIIPAEIGVNTTRTITLTNIGNETLRLPENAITIAGDGGVFTVTQPGNLVLAPGQSTTFTVTVNPPATQTYEAIVTVNADPPSQPRSFQVIARGQIMLSLLDEAGRDYFSPDYGEFDFGVVLPPGVATRSQEFLIRNTGQNAIQLTGAPLFQLHGTGVDFFRIGGVADFLEQFPGGLIPGGATGRIRIIFSPEILNQVTADFRVPVSVAGVDEDMETVLIGNIPPDRMVVYGGGYIIEAGSTQPRRRDHTDFGDAELRTEETITRRYTIYNNTDEVIAIEDIDLVVDNGGWSISAPVSPTLTPGATTTFDVTFHPHLMDSVPQDGIVPNQVSIVSDYALETDYRFAVVGRAFAPAIRVDSIRRERNPLTGMIESEVVARIIDSGPGDAAPTNEPSAEELTHYGSTHLGDPQRISFRITNTGNAPLYLENNALINLVSVAIDDVGYGFDYDQFRISELPEPIVPPGSSTSFTVELRSLFVSRRFPYDTASPDAPLPTPGDTEGVGVEGLVRIDTNSPNVNHQPFWFLVRGDILRSSLTVQGIEIDGVSVINPSPHYRNDIRVYGDDQIASRLGITVPHAQRSARVANLTDMGGTQVGGLRRHHFIVRNDSTDAITLNGSPLVNVATSSGEDFSAVAYVERDEDDGSPIPITGPVDLDPGEFIFVALDFTPNRTGIMDTEIRIRSTDEVAPVYRFPVRARGLAAHVKVTDLDEVLIPRDQTTPTTVNSTRLQPGVYIADAAPLSGVVQTYRLVNVGNQTLTLGEDTLGDWEELGPITLSGPRRVDFFVARHPYNEAGEEVTFLLPGEEAFFDIAFDPEYYAAVRNPDVQDTWQHPEEQFRIAVVTVNTSNTSAEEYSGVDAYSFTIGATAINPIIQVLGRGYTIYDRQYSPEVQNNTVYRDTDIWGGRTDHTFTVRNAGRLHELHLGHVGQPYFDNEETIFAIPIERIEGNRVYIPGFSIDPVNGVSAVTLPAAFIPEPGELNDVPYIASEFSVDASMLSRLRVGDEITIDGVTQTITKIYPDANDIMDLPPRWPPNDFVTIQPHNLPPPDLIGPADGPGVWQYWWNPMVLPPFATIPPTDGGVNEWNATWTRFFSRAASSFPLGHDFELPLRGYIETEEAFPSNLGGSMTIEGPGPTRNQYWVSGDARQWSHFNIPTEGNPARDRWYYIEQAFYNGDDTLITVPDELIGASPFWEDPGAIIGALLQLNNPDADEAVAQIVLHEGNSAGWTAPFFGNDGDIVYIQLSDFLGLENGDSVFVYLNGPEGPWYELIVVDDDVELTPPGGDPEDDAEEFMRFRISQEMIDAFDTMADLYIFLETGTYRVAQPITVATAERKFAHFTKKDFFLLDTLPDAIEPGEEVLMTVRFLPRWSTGFDRERQTIAGEALEPFTEPIQLYPPSPFTWYHWTLPDRLPPLYPEGRLHTGLATTNFPETYLPMGWNSTRLDTNAGMGGRANSSMREAYTEEDTMLMPLREDPDSGNDYQARGWVQHWVEVNIPNTDIDTWGNWKTGQTLSFPPGVYPHPYDDKDQWFAHNNAYGEFTDGVAPDMEFALLGIGRNPRIVLENVPDPWKLGAPPYDGMHPPYLAGPPAAIPPVRHAPGAFQFPATEVLESTMRRVIIRAGRNWWWDTAYGSVYQPTGRLLLDPDIGRAATIQGPVPHDYDLIVADPDDTDYIMPGGWVWDDDNDPTNVRDPERHGFWELIYDYDADTSEVVVLDIYFTPTSVTDPDDLDGQPFREAVLVIPSNDATEDPLRVPLVGAGEASDLEGDF